MAKGYETKFTKVSAKTTKVTPKKTPAKAKAKPMTEQQKLNAQYKNLANMLQQNNQRNISDYQAEQQRLANQQRLQTGAQYDKTQNQNYINYMMSQKALPGQLARLGITGGAAESSQLRANTNYENVKNATEGERNSALNNITNTMNNNLAQYRLTADADLRSKLYSNEQQRMAALQKLKEAQKQEKLAKKQRQYDRYRDTIRRFDTIGKVDKAIARARKSKQPSWKIQLLQAQRADLVAKAKEEGTASGSGGGRRRSGGGGGYRRSYSRRSYGGRSSSATTVKTEKKSKKSTTKKKASKPKASKSKFSGKGKGTNYFPQLGPYGSMSVEWVKRK